MRPTGKKIQPGDPMTERQKEIYEFICSRVEPNRSRATIREIADHFGIGGPNGVLCHLTALAKRGLIKRERGRTGIVVLPPPEPQAEQPAELPPW